MSTSQTYTLDGPRDFTFPFPVRTADQITVSITPGGVLPSSEYQVIGASATANSITIRYPNAPTDGTKSLIIERRTEPQRVSTFLNDLSITATALNAEFDNVLQLIQDGILSEFRGDWGSGEAYSGLDVVRFAPEGNIYLAVESHTSDDFATDLAEGKWVLVADFETGQLNIDAALQAAEAARDKAEQWAQEEEDTEVEPGEFSAFHYANKAEGSASSAEISADAASSSEQNAATSEQNASDSADDASTSASNALDSENRAQQWAQEDEDVEVDPGEFSAFHWAQKAQEFAGGPASTISYDNATSGLAATDVQAALDEVSDAENISYDNTDSGLDATNVQAAIDEVAGDLANFEAVPSGAVMFFAMDTAPDGFLKANGAAVSRTTFSALFNAIGTTFGSGDGSTTFNLPDMRGEFPRGWDDGRGVDSGRSFSSAQDNAIQNITGTFGWKGNERTTSDVFFDAGNSPFPNSSGTSGSGALIGFDASRVVSTAGETRPRNIALLACIKF